jgi:sulfate permease, SulP family
MPPSTATQRGLALPVFQALLPIGRAELLRDLVAGATLAALAIPEVMGYTRISGTPVVTGLYTLLVPAVLFALFGSSRLLVVGADSATAAIMAGSLAGVAAPSTPQWVALAGLLALLAAGLLLAARLARLAFLADFLSRTVLAGFLTGVGLQVALSELPGMLGLQPGTLDVLARLQYTIGHAADVHAIDAAIGIGAAVLIVIVRSVSRSVPGPLLAVLAALAASWWFDLPSHGVAVVGTVQGGLPNLALPAGLADWTLLRSLVPTALAMAVVILAQSAATARAYAWKYDSPVSENADLVALSLANLGAGLTGAFVVNGSPTKTEMVDAAGGRSQWAHLTMAGFVLLVLLYFTEPISLLPTAALSGIVFLIGLELVKLRELRHILAVRPSEFWVAAATAGTVLLFGVEIGIGVAFTLSMVDHTRRGYRPRNEVIARGEDGHARLVPVSQPQDYEAGLLIYRFSHSMYYANADLMAAELASLVSGARSPLRWLVLDMGAVDDVDFSAAQTLLSLRTKFAAHGTSLKFLRPTDAVAAQLRAYGLVETEGAAPQVFASIRALRHRYEAAVGPTAQDKANR